MIKAYFLMKVLEQLVRIVQMVPKEDEGKELYIASCKKIMEIIEGVKVNKT